MRDQELRTEMCICALMSHVHGIPAHIWEARGCVMALWQRGDLVLFLFMISGLIDWTPLRSAAFDLWLWLPSLVR
jgi:hypothetical protein